MHEPSHAFLKHLLETPSPSGFERPIQDVVRSWAREFANRSERVLSAGRPPCPLCDEPLDPQGHICVRTNGYLRAQISGSDDDPEA